MTAYVILGAYGAAGLVAALLAMARQEKQGLTERAWHALLTLVLWPFLLPVMLSPGEVPAGARVPARSERARRLDDVTGRLEECWRRAVVESPWLAEQAREHRLLDGFVARLRAQERRLVEVEAALASAPASVKDRLAQLREHSAAELEHSIGLVEELAAQLTLLRFADLGNPSAVRVERGHIEELLLRIGALAEASQPGAGAVTPGPVARA